MKVSSVTQETRIAAPMAYWALTPDYAMLMESCKWSRKCELEHSIRS